MDILKEIVLNLQGLESHQSFVQNAGEESILQVNVALKQMLTEDPYLFQETTKRACDNRSHGDDTGNNNITDKAVVRERQSDFLSRTIAGIPCDPELLPPGAQCILAASKVTCFLSEEHTTIPTGVRGTSCKGTNF